MRRPWLAFRAPLRHDPQHPTRAIPALPCFADDQARGRRGSDTTALAALVFVGVLAGVTIVPTVRLMRCGGPHRLTIAVTAAIYTRPRPWAPQAGCIAPWLCV